MNKSIKFLSEDLNYGLKIPMKLVNKMKGICMESFPNETGGILIGKYSSDQIIANVTFVTGPPTDSQSGRNWFKRGIKGLQKMLDDSWEEKQTYYLGEWHFHPNGPPLPSPVDIREMKGISQNKSYSCPEPILIILNGNKEDYKVNPFVFPTDEYITL